MGNYFDKFKSAGIPFMEGREKGNLSDVMEETLHIMDYGFINGDDGKYAVMLFGEHDNFYFGNSIITEMLMEVEADGMRDELAYQPVHFEQRQSKNGKRTYTTYVFE